MKYDTKELELKAIELLKDEKLNIFFVNQLCANLGINKQTYYNHSLDQIDSINELLENNKVRTWTSQLNKWYKSDNATLQIALFKTIATDEMAARVSNQTVVNNNVNQLELSKEQILEIAKQMILENPELKAEIQKELE